MKRDFPGSVSAGQGGESAAVRPPFFSGAHANGLRDDLKTLAQWERYQGLWQMGGAGVLLAIAEFALLALL